MLILRLAVFIFAFILIQNFPGYGTASLDGSFPLKNGTITRITDYNRMDQCMAEPGYYHVHHNSLLFFLQKHQFCGGGPKGEEGLLICYRGQMDKVETVPNKGLRTTRQFEFWNVPGNAVAKRCEDAGYPNWHGILIYTNDQGQWVIKFSTTNHTFVIPKIGSESRLELLVYKLASAKDGGESFLSKIFGPKRDFMDWGKRDSFGVAEEENNRIRHAGNEQLKKLFMELLKHQALLRNYVGIWSLGLDMLPTDENVFHLDLYTQKSECCKDIQAFYNLPTAQYPDPKKEQVDLKDGANGMETNFVENFTATLDGIVDSDAKYLTFELVDLFQPEDKAQGIRLIVNFTATTIIFQQKIGNEWKEAKKSTEIKHHFAPGIAFHLFFILSKKGVVVNMNCYGQIPLPADPINKKTEFDFKNLHRLTMDGGFKLTKPVIYAVAGKPDIGYQWQIKEGISAENSSGIVVRGKVGDENAKKFSIKLWSRDADRFFQAILELEIDILGPTIKYSEGKNPATGVTFEKEKPKYDNAGSPFEALIQFKEDIFEIWMNNSKMNQQYNATAGFGVVNYVQIRGDASGKMVQLQKTPMECVTKRRMSAENDAYLNITGKVLPGSGGFNIELMHSDKALPLLLTATFSGLTSEVVLREITDTGNQPEWVYPEELQDVMKMGEDFHLKIQYQENASEILVAINGAKHIFTSQGQFAPANMYKISDGIIILEALNHPPCVPHQKKLE